MRQQNNNINNLFYNDGPFTLLQNKLLRDNLKLLNFSVRIQIHVTA